MEIQCQTDERFMFPSFELTNWYAARNILELLRGSVYETHSIIYRCLQSLTKIQQLLMIIYYSVRNHYCQYYDIG